MNVEWTSKNEQMHNTNRLHCKRAHLPLCTQSANFHTLGPSRKKPVDNLLPSKDAHRNASWNRQVHGELKIPSKDRIHDRRRIHPGGHNSGSWWFPTLYSVHNEKSLSQAVKFHQTYTLSSQHVRPHGSATNTNAKTRHNSNAHNLKITIIELLRDHFHRCPRVHWTMRASKKIGAQRAC